MIKRIVSTWYISAIVCLAFVGCTNSKQLAYFQDLKDTSKILKVEQLPYKALKLKVDDELRIFVSSSTPEAASFFNATSASVPSGSGGGSSSGNSSGTPGAGTYMVTPNGYITLPVIGDMQVIGLTTEEVKNKIVAALQPYLKDAVVSVHLSNFKVTVIGDVARPNVVNVDGERINALEAVGRSGDMTIYGTRYNVKVFRKDSTGIMDVATLNFNTSKMLQSPFFQLQQNDVLYVEPLGTKGYHAERATLLLPTLVSLSTLVITLISIVTLKR